jgi:hypothetical protein
VRRHGAPRSPYPPSQEGKVFSGAYSENNVLTTRYNNNATSHTAKGTMTHTAAVPAELSAAAPDLARRVGLTLGGLCAVVAARLYRLPLLAALTVPVWTRISRARHRLERLLAQLAEGRLPRTRHAAPRRAPSEEPTAPVPPPEARAPRPRLAPLPRRRSWLVVAVGYEAAGYASQLRHLLADPAMVEVLATVPAACRIVRPLLRMLGLPDDLVPRPPAPPGAAAKPARKRPRRHPRHRPAPAARAAAPPAPEPVSTELWPWQVPRPRYAIP